MLGNQWTETRTGPLRKATVHRGVRAWLGEAHNAHGARRMDQGEGSARGEKSVWAAERERGRERGCENEGK